MPDKKQPGYTTKIYYGTVGATAATQILHAVDVDLDATITYAETTDRGDGTKVPHEDQEPVKIGVKITWSMRAKDNDAQLIALLAAATHTTAANRLKAIKYTNPVTGVMFDGDCDLKIKDTSSLAGAINYDFEATPTTAGGREWLLNGL